MSVHEYISHTAILRKVENVGHFRPQLFLSFDIHVGKLDEKNSGDGLLVVRSEEKSMLRVM